MVRVPAPALRANGDSAGARRPAPTRQRSHHSPPVRAAAAASAPPGGDGQRFLTTQSISAERPWCLGGSTIKSWNKDITISLNQFAFNETYRVSRNFSYKYTATVKAYKDGEPIDTVTFDSKIVSY
jgi:hypothetical protein